MKKLFMLACLAAISHCFAMEENMELLISNDEIAAKIEETGDAGRCRLYTSKSVHHGSGFI